MYIGVGAECVKRVDLVGVTEVGSREGARGVGLRERVQRSGC